MLFPPKVELGKATKATVRHCKDSRRGSRSVDSISVIRNNLTTFLKCLFQAKNSGLNLTTSLTQLLSIGRMLTKTCRLSLVKWFVVAGLHASQLKLPMLGYTSGIIDLAI